MKSNGLNLKKEEIQIRRHKKFCKGNQATQYLLRKLLESSLLEALKNKVDKNLVGNQIKTLIKTSG